MWISGQKTYYYVSLYLFTDHDHHTDNTHYLVERKKEKKEITSHLFSPGFNPPSFSSRTFARE